MFELKIRCNPGYTVTLQLRKGPKLCFNQERKLFYALLVKVNKDLDTVEADGIISLVTTSNCGTPLSEKSLNIRWSWTLSRLKIRCQSSNRPG